MILMLSSLKEIIKMAIKKDFKLDSNGKKTRLYIVTAEALNIHTGQRRSKKRRGITSKQKAERMYKELWNQCRNEKPDKVLNENTGQLGGLIDTYLSHIEGRLRSRENPDGYSLGTFRNRGFIFQHLKPWYHVDISKVTPRFLNQVLDDLEKSRSLSKIRTRCIFAECKSLFSYAYDAEILKENPFKGCKNRPYKPKEQYALNHKEANGLLREAYKRKHPYYFVWLLAITLGLRRSELAGLKWTDIDFEQRILHVQRQLVPREGLVEKTKTSRNRIVAIPQKIMPTLKDFQSKAKSDFVINLKCNNWRGGDQARVLRWFCQKIGIKQVTFHQLRATHITLAIQDGVSTGAIMSNVGHTTLATTSKYFRLSGVHVQGETDRLGIDLPQDLVSKAT